MFTNLVSVTVGSIADTGLADFMSVVARSGLTVACSEDHPIPMVIQNPAGTNIGSVNAAGLADFMSGNFRSGLTVAASDSPLAFVVANSVGAPVASIDPTGKADFSFAGIRTQQLSVVPAPASGRDGDILVSTATTKLYARIGGVWHSFAPDA
jgi:hypothetical protein